MPSTKGSSLPQVLPRSPPSAPLSASLRGLLSLLGPLVSNWERRDLPWRHSRVEKGRGRSRESIGFFSSLASSTLSLSPKPPTRAPNFSLLQPRPPTPQSPRRSIPQPPWVSSPSRSQHSTTPSPPLLPPLLLPLPCPARPPNSQTPTPRSSPRSSCAPSRSAPPPTPRPTRRRSPTSTACGSPSSGLGTAAR